MPGLQRRAAVVTACRLAARMAPALLYPPCWRSWDRWQRVEYSTPQHVAAEALPRSSYRPVNRTYAPAGRRAIDARPWRSVVVIVFSLPDVRAVHARRLVLWRHARAFYDTCALAGKGRGDVCTCKPMRTRMVRSHRHSNCQRGPLPRCPCGVPAAARAAACASTTVARWIPRTCARSRGVACTHRYRLTRVPGSGLCMAHERRCGASRRFVAPPQGELLAYGSQVPGQVCCAERRGRPCVGVLVRRACWASVLRCLPPPSPADLIPAPRPPGRHRLLPARQCADNPG